MAPDQSLLVTTSRRIGSVLGKIVATTEQSFARKQNKLSPKKRTMFGSERRERLSCSPRESSLSGFIWEQVVSPPPTVQQARW